MLGSVVSVFSCIAAGYVVRQYWVAIFKRRFSLAPMGLTSRKKAKAHAILDISAFDTFDCWAKQLERSGRCTLLKQVPKAVKENALAICSVSSTKLGWQHFMVVLEHERRAIQWRSVANLAALMRFLVARCMVGTVTEFRSTTNNCLIAWSMDIVKGDTFRAMWFYQADAAIHSKMYIWFASLRLTMIRAMSTKGVRFVDLGPSTTSAVVDIKTKFGFEETTDWQMRCDYSGNFAEIAPADTSMLL